MVRRVHLRYEDDFYNQHRPFSMGLTIDKIQMGNAQSHWTFHTPCGMKFTKTPNDYVNKEFDIVKLRVYVNTQSETLIPYTLIEQTQNTKYKIYSAMDASLLRHLMCT
jgi:Vacuolar sorting-associated protein 13, N-terminal